MYTNPETKPANVAVQRLQTKPCDHTSRTQQSDATALLAEGRTDRPPTSPHRSPPERFCTDRSPLATALTNYLLGAFALTDNPQTTASTDHLLGTFGLADNFEEQVQRL